MIDDYQPSLVCIVEAHAKRRRNPNTRIVLCIVMTDQQREILIGVRDNIKKYQFRTNTAK